MQSQTLGLKDRYDAVVREHGPWSAHNVEYAPGLFTIQPSLAGQELRLRRVLQVVIDAVGERSIESLRILDLACLEGLYALEFARRGAKVVAIDGREANIAKVEFVRDALNLDNLQTVIDDVRNLSKSKYGEFDVVLCAGILYHIDQPDVFHFLKRIREVTRLFVFLDTHVARQSSVEIEFEGIRYWGDWYQEFKPDATTEEKKNNRWAALDNPRSFWFAQGSLIEALSRSGFSTVGEILAPLYAPESSDRQMFIAWTGSTVEPLLTPQVRISRPLDYQSALMPDRAQLIHQLQHNRRSMTRSILARFRKILRNQRT